MSELRRHIMMQQAGGGILPTEYQQVEYIETDGSSYFSFTTPRFVNMRNAEFEAIYAAAGVNQYIFDAYASSKQITLSVIGRRTYVAFGFGMTDYAGVNGGFDEYYNKRVIAKGSAIRENNITTFLVEGELNGVVRTDSKTISSDTFETNTFRVARANPPYYFLVGKLWDLYLKDDIGDAFNLIPCYRKVDNVAGMYDIVNDAFHPSDTATPFVAGPDV